MRLLLLLLRLLHGGGRGRATITPWLLLREAGASATLFAPSWGWGIPFGTSTFLRPLYLVLMLIMLLMVLLF
jgi:hypothetical protein